MIGEEDNSAGVGSMLGQRRRRWPNIEPTPDQIIMWSARFIAEQSNSRRQLASTL